MGALFLTLVFCFILAVVYFTYLLIVTAAVVARRVTWRSEPDMFTRIEAEKLKEYEQARQRVRDGLN